MVTELTRFSVKTEEDILHLHKLCMDLGLWAGLPVPDSTRFAAGIATHSNPFNSEVMQVCFSIEEKENQSCLLAKIQNHSRNIENCIVQPIPSIPVSPFDHIMPDNVVTTEKAGDTSPDVVKPVSPAAVFAKVQEEFAEDLNQKNAEIRVDFSAVPQINYIEVFLKCIFTNLISNAIKYSSSHRPLRLCIT